MKRKLIVLVILLVLFSLIILSLFGLNGTGTGKVTSSSGSSKPTPTIPINYSNFAKEEAKNEIIRALPDDGVILLKFYSVSGSEQKLEKSYVIKKSQIQEGSVEGADMILSLRDTYLNGLTNKNFCSVITKANNNGELGIELGKSVLSLGWQYKSVMKYKSCFGM